MPDHPYVILLSFGETHPPSIRDYVICAQPLTDELPLKQLTINYPRDHLHEKTAITGKSLQSSRIAHATYNLQLVGYYPQESVHLGETLHSPAQLS